MKYTYVFLLGRPACGKSTLYRGLEKRILASGQARTFERVDDFPKLWAKLQADDAREQGGKERIDSGIAADGSYVLKDHVFNDILKEVNADVLKIDKPDHMIFLEFSRSDYVEAFQNFDQSILQNCVVIYIQVDFDTCWARNVARHEAAIAEDGDDHLVPWETMERIYLHDDRDAFVQYIRDQGIPVSVVDNKAGGEEHLKGLVEELFDNLFK